MVTNNALDLKRMSLDDFPFISYDKIRYCDTDRQQHVNNAIFSTFVETGRVELFFNPEDPMVEEGCSFVIANMQLDLLKEIKWPGIVEIGTGVIKIGNSSMHLVQCVYQKGVVAATAKTVIVQVDEKTGQSKPMSDAVKEKLSRYLMS